MAQNSVSVIPELNKLEDYVLDYTPTDEEQTRGLRVQERIDACLNARAPYEHGMERGILLYDGIHLIDPKNKSNLTNDNVVAPFARIFVDAKTAEETRSFSEYTFRPVEDSNDSWKVDLLKEINEHVRRVMKQKSKRHQLIRMKNIAGVSIARIGYRRIMGMRKMRTETNEHGDMIKWKEVPVPVYDDLFMDIVSPMDFAIDPNATTMDDAMDCVYFHKENFEGYWEEYKNNPLFKNTDKVKPGVHGRLGDKGFYRGGFAGYSDEKNMVLITEYFNKIRDEWVVYANGVEIYYGALPDDHKELPFISYHNNSSFSTGFVEATTRTVDGEEVAYQPEVRMQESFWTIGDPQTMMDLIELRTAHGRAAHRAMKRASQVIVATKGNFRFPNDRNYMDGDVVPGGAGQFEVAQLGVQQAGNWQWAFDDLFQLMRLTAGIDPSNLSDMKTKTATEAEIQFETSMRRLQQNIEYNEENGEQRMGMLTHKIIQQRYTKPEIVQLTGYETENEIKRFDEIEKDTDTGLPIYGKRYRRIRTSFNIKESDSGKMISRDDAGVSSFIARPEYIRTSEIDIMTTTNRKAGQIKSIQAQKALRGLELIAQLLPLTQPDPVTGEALISKDDLPDVKALSKMLISAYDLDEQDAMGTKDAQKSKTEKEAESIQAAFKNRTPITEALNAVPA